MEASRAIEDWLRPGLEVEFDIGLRDRGLVPWTGRVQFVHHDLAKVTYAHPHTSLECERCMHRNQLRRSRRG